MKATPNKKSMSQPKELLCAGVEPLYSTLELETLPVRQDLGEPPKNRSQLMANSVLTEEEYFVAPPGNVPLSVTKSYSE